MKAVQLLINSFLPEDLRDYSRTYDARDINALMYEVAQKYPDRFADVVKHIADVGRKTSYYMGSSITLDDLEPVVDKKEFFAKMDAELDAIPKGPDRERKWREVSQKYNTMLERTISSRALANRNNIAMSVLSGARGKNAQLKAAIGTPWTFSDYKGEPVDIISRESFAEGIRPYIYAASTNGSRAAVTSTKRATAQGGDWAKQMAASAADMVVRKDDCGTSNGISMPIDDASLVGRALAKDAGGFHAGEFVTPRMLQDLRKSGAERVVVRSPLTCGVHDGLCAHCVGKFYHGGKLPKVGDAVGLIASTVAAEPVTQMALCLGADTEVRMADGSDRKIQDIKPGEIVLGADTEGATFPVRVVDVYDRGVKSCNVYVWERDGKDPVKLVCTPDHMFLFLNITEGGTDVAPCGEASAGLAAMVTDGSLLYFGEPVESGVDVQCFDIEVDHPDHLFVLASGLITSNSAKHTAGMTQSKKTYSGLGVIQQFTQSPEKFKDRGAVSEVDGVVDRIEDAEQGGKYIFVSGKAHYVPAGHDPEVEVGQRVEAGDQLAEGLVDAEDIVRLKGLGAGRLYYAQRLNRILEDSGAKTDPRNTEVLARAVLRHVRITGNDPVGSYEPDDIVDYNAMASTYKMAEGTRLESASNAIGKYLQQPVMHHTIGTRVTKSMAADLDANGYHGVYVADTKPSFKPEMVRLRAASHSNPDWLASLGTSYLTKQLHEGATSGDDTNVEQNTDYRPRLMIGTNFGSRVGETGKF